MRGIVGRWGRGGRDCKDGALVGELAFHHCNPGAICELSLLFLLLVLAPRGRGGGGGFSGFSGFPFSTKTKISKLQLDKNRILARTPTTWRSSNRDSFV